MPMTRFADTLARTLSALALVALAGLVLVAALAGLAVALFLGVAEVVHPAWAALVTALFGLLVGVGCLLLARTLTRPPPASPPPAGHAPPEGSPEPEDGLARLQALAERVSPSARRNLGSLAVVAFLGGVLLGARPELRRELIAVLQPRL